MLKIESGYAYKKNISSLHLTTLGSPTPLIHVSIATFSALHISTKNITRSRTTTPLGPPPTALLYRVIVMYIDIRVGNPNPKTD